jgi:Zn-dependent protease
LLVLIAGLGWAKPVRFNPGALRTDPRMGALIVAIAGPISNLLLAVAMAVLWRVVEPVLPLDGASQTTENLIRLFFLFALLNVGLFFFNLIPLAPLDGFTVLRGLLPHSLAYQLERIQPYSALIFLVLFVFGDRIPIFSWLVWQPARAITEFLFF